ncbi:hypothetical protein D3C81_837660 [compost metagenome]
MAELSELISSYVEADPTAFYTYDEYEQALPQLLSTNAGQVESIRQQLDGTIASSGDGSGSGGSMGGGMGEWRNARAAADGSGQGDAAEQSVPAAGAERGAQAGAGADAAGGETGGPPALPEGFQPPEGFPGDAGAPGDAAGGAGQARPMGGDRTQGGGIPGGGAGFEAAATAAGSGADVALFTGISLLVLLGAVGFVAFFRRKRL